MRTDNVPEIIAAACDGDSEAIEQVLLHYQPAVTRFAYKYCATSEDVQDAVQETLWIASQKLGTVQSPAAFVSWLFRIVQRQCYRLLHYKKREDSLDQLAGTDHAEVSPENVALLHQDLVTAMAQLPAAYRQVVIMRDIQELTGPEVAARLHLTLETVKSRLHRGRQILRQTLQDWAE